jgi:hypothetical protein
MSVDVKIYIAGVKKFFNSNEDDLKSLVPLEKKEEFYKEIEKVAQKNFDSGEEITLTQSQYIDICLKLNGGPKKNKEKRREQIQFIENAFGKIFLN